MHIATAPRPGGAVHAGRSARLRRAGPVAVDRSDRLSDRGRPVRDAGHPAVAGAGLWRHASRHGIGRQRQHDRHGGGRSSGGLFQPSHPAAPGHRRQPGIAVDPDRVARDRPRPRHLHRAAGGARHLHVRGLHADAGLSRRTVQRWRCGRGARGLRHRQCREQSVRSPAIGCRSRPSGPRQQFLRVRFAQPQRCRAGLVLARAHALDDGAESSRRARRSPPGSSTCATRRYDAALPSGS